MLSYENMKEKAYREIERLDKAEKSLDVELSLIHIQMCIRDSSRFFTGSTGYINGQFFEAAAESGIARHRMLNFKEIE